MRRVNFALGVLAAFAAQTLSLTAHASECKLYPIGQDRPIQHQDSIRSAQFSPDSSKVVTASWDGTSKVLDLNSGKETIIQHGDWVTSAQFSPDGSKVVTASLDYTSKTLDLKSGKETIIQHSGGVMSAQFSPDGSKVVTASSDSAKILDLKSGKETTIQYGYGGRSAQFSPDGSKIVTTSWDNTAKILDLNSGKETTIRHSSDINSAQFSPDSSKVVTASSNRAKVLDLKSGKETTIHHKGEVKSAQFSPDGSKVVTASWDDTVIKILDLNSGKETIIQHEDWVTSAQFSPDGSKVVITSYHDTVIHDLNSGKKTTLFHRGGITSAEFSPDGSKAILVSSDKTTRITSIPDICTPTDLKLATLPGTSDCTDCFTNPQEGTPTASATQLIEELELKTLCSAPIDTDTASNWRKLIPSSDQLSSPIPTKLALQALLKFQKPRGFEPAKDLALLLAILKSDFITRHPGLIARAMQSVLHSSNALYEELTREIPQLSELTDSGDKTPSCRTKEEETLLSETAQKHVEYLLAINGKYSRFSDWPLKPLTPLLAKLPPPQRDSFISDIALKLADAAADTYEYRDIFHSKLYKFAHEAVAPLFGVKAKSFSDLTLVREAHQIRPVLLGTGPMVLESKNPNSADSVPTEPTSQISEFGFSTQSLPAISVDDLSADTPQQQTLRWTQEGKTFTADLKLKLGQKDQVLVPVADAPDYPGLWKDRTLTGMIIAGTNLSSHSKSLMDQYLVYYGRDGFQFEDTPREVSDLPAFLKEITESGKLDYFIKSAHSDGDEKNLFRMDLKGKVFVGKRVIPKDSTQQELIYLVFPDPQSKESRLVGNQEFGDWLRTREKKGGQQLVYINGSCWSKTKAVHEIEAAGTPLLLNIPTTTTTWTFSLDPKNVESILLTGLRAGQSYAEIRTKMETNEGYKSGKTDQYIFPDEERYKREILDLLTKPVIQNLTLTRDGQPYNIEQSE